MLEHGLTCDLGPTTSRVPIHRQGPHTWFAEVWVPAGVYYGGHVYTPADKAIPFVLTTAQGLFCPGKIMITFYDGDESLAKEIREALALAA